MVILRKNWIYSTSNNPNPGKLFLTFKWDPRYRSFLFNYTEEPYIASQAFWVFTIKNEKKFEKEFFLAWMNSTLSMAIIYELADVQRKVWRQLSGSRINNLLTIKFDFITDLTLLDREIIFDFNTKPFEKKLTEELKINSILLSENNSDMFNERIKVDLLFLQLLMSNLDNYQRKIKLKEFYEDFLEELEKLS